MSIVYIWCQLNKDTIVNFWFGTQFKAMYLPWVLFGFKLIISGGGVMELIGILIGHMYFFLMFKYPQVRHLHLTLHLHLFHCKLCSTKLFVFVF